MATNQYGDNMMDFLWDGPEDSDEEIEDMALYKTKYEKEKGIKFSKRGIIEYIEKLIAEQNPDNKENPHCARQWEEKVKTNGLKMYLKRGGSDQSESQPWLRS